MADWPKKTRPEKAADILKWSVLLVPVIVTDAVEKLPLLAIAKGIEPPLRHLPAAARQPSLRPRLIPGRNRAEVQGNRRKELHARRKSSHRGLLGLILRNFRFLLDPFGRCALFPGDQLFKSLTLDMDIGFHSFKHRCGFTAWRGG
jgi:hypothetical protein